MAEKTGKLPTRTKVFYGIGDLGNAVVNSAIQFFLMKFYTDGALILPALAGNALLIGKIWDAINDPLFGWLTDKTKSRFGKRRVFMIFGAIPLAIAVASVQPVPCVCRVLMRGNARMSSPPSHTSRSSMVARVE